MCRPARRDSGHTIDSTFASCFLVSVVACGKPGSPHEKAIAPHGSASAASSPSDAAALPSSRVHELAEIGLSVTLPETASLTDVSPVEPSFHVRMRGGYRVYFSKHTDVDFAEVREGYRSKTAGFLGMAYDAEDGLVARRDEPGVGAYCEVTACSKPLPDGPMCAVYEGAASDQGPKLTEQECRDVIAIARSIVPLR